MSRFPRLAWSAVAALTLAACAQPAEKKYPHAIITPQPAKDVPAVELVQGDNKPFQLQDHRGKWVWLYFGFANCPDVCPQALEELAAEYRLLKQPEKVQVVFVSVDPARDRPEALKKYTAFYHPAFLGVTGEKAALETLAKPLGIGYVLDQPATPGGGYNVSHSNLITVIDPAGQYAATYVPGAEAGKLAEDFNRLTR